jgi:predicted nucleic-acid-binding Zn-ribbon protein
MNCPKCQSENFSDMLGSQKIARISVREKGKKDIVIGGESFDVKIKMCEDCGYMEMYNYTYLESQGKA